MSSELKVLQVIPKLGYGGAETGCYDLAHYLPENNCSSYIVTSGGELLKFIDRKKGYEKYAPYLGFLLLILLMISILKNTRRGW